MNTVKETYGVPTGRCSVSEVVKCGACGRVASTVRIPDGSSINGWSGACYETRHESGRRYWLCAPCLNGAGLGTMNACV